MKKQYKIILHLLAFIADLWLIFWLGSLLPWQSDPNKPDWFVVPYCMTVLIIVAAHVWSFADVVSEK